MTTGVYTDMPRRKLPQHKRVEYKPPREPMKFTAKTPEVQCSCGEPERPHTHYRDKWNYKTGTCSSGRHSDCRGIFTALGGSKVVCCNCDCHVPRRRKMTKGRG